MNLTSVNNLEAWKKKGFYYKGKEVDESSSTSQGGTKSTLIRGIAYRYELHLQGLSQSEVVAIEDEILTASITEEEVAVDLTSLSGYLNHKGITGTPSFICDSSKTKTVEGEDGIITMVIPLTELDINPASRLGV